MTFKKLAKFIIPAISVAVVRFLMDFAIESFSDLIIGPLAGIFLGVPGAVGCAVGTLAFNLIFGEPFGMSLLYMLPSLAATLIPFWGRRFLKYRGSFKNTWIFFAISVAASLVVALLWGIYPKDGMLLAFASQIPSYVSCFISLSFAFTYPIYFIITSIQDRSQAKGRPLVNVYAFWLLAQVICSIWLASKVYVVAPDLDLNQRIADWSKLNIYLLLLEMLILALGTLADRFKRVMLFITAGLACAVLVFNIINYDTGEGVYIVAFVALWAACHAIFYPWYENKALKKRYVKVVSTVLHGFLLLVLVLVYALDIATYIIPRANGTEANVIVLGAPVVENEASGILEERISVATDFLKKDQDAKAILTGGTKVDGGKTEAQIIRDGLVAGGISDERLIIEDQAKTTEENFERCLEIVRENGGNENEEVVIVTSQFHLLRSGIYARRAGFNNLVFLGSQSLAFKEWSWCPREVLSLIPVLFD